MSPGFNEYGRIVGKVKLESKEEFCFSRGTGKCLWFALGYLSIRGWVYCKVNYWPEVVGQRKKRRPFCNGLDRG